MKKCFEFQKPENRQFVKEILPEAVRFAEELDLSCRNYKGGDRE